MIKHSLIIACLAFPTMVSSAAAESVREAFERPLETARTEVWYHLPERRINSEILKADFAALAEADIGMANIFMTNIGALKPNVEPLTPKWFGFYREMIGEAKKYGMTLGFHNCPGWSETGGPWITPENAMKIVVASETDVTDSSSPVKLAQPLTINGFYHDLAVVAFPLAAKPKLLRVSGNFSGDAACFMNGTKPLSLPLAKEGDVAVLTLEYDRAFAPRTVRYRFEDVSYWLRVKVESSSDGTNFSEIAKTDFKVHNAQKSLKTQELPPSAPARFFRFTLLAGETYNYMAHRVRTLHSLEFTDMAFVSSLDAANGAEAVHSVFTCKCKNDPGLATATMRDVTAALGADGTFDFKAAGITPTPAVPWRLLRVGYTLTGKKNHPSCVSGLECDKLSKKGIEAHWPHMPAKMLAVPGARDVVKLTLIDSWEVGGQNWTEAMADEFRARRGYDLKPWFAALCGYVVATRGETERFLADYRRTVAELCAENYFGRFAELCHEAGIESAAELTYAPCDAIIGCRKIDIPTAEHSLHTGPWSPRLMSSAAHVNGHRCVASESFLAFEKQGRWQITPAELRYHADRGWLYGINRHVIHSWIHQPLLNVKPSLSLGPYGSHVNRNLTWLPEMKHWSAYMRRGQSLLQSGLPQAQLLIVADDGAPNRFQLDLASAVGYNYDFSSATDLKRLTVKDGEVAFPGLRPYAVIYLGNNTAYTIDTLKAIKKLAASGARLAGGMPLTTPSLADDRGEWKRLVDELKASGAIRPAEHGLAALKAFKIRPDIDSNGKRIEGLRRIIGHDDLYFVMNMGKEAFVGEVSFATINPASRMERLDAHDGRCWGLETRPDGAGRLIARLKLEPRESAFLAVERTSSVQQQARARTPLPHETSSEQQQGDQVIDISTNWKLDRFIGPGAPTAPVTLASLKSWSEASDEKLKYFSGRATYSREITIPANAKEVMLDLGDVREIANVKLDGKFIGCLWDKPCRIELLHLARGASPTSAGTSNAVNMHTHLLEIEVVNTWPNRMIGDARARKAGAAEPRRKGEPYPAWVMDDKPDSGTGIYTWSNYEGWSASDNLLPAGLLGPVKLIVTTEAIRPYELVWAGKTADETPEIADIADASAWEVVSSNATATFTRTTERSVFGEASGRLTWRGTSADTAVSLRPRRPLAITNDFTFASVWLWGDMTMGKKDPDHMPLKLQLDFEDAKGHPYSIVSRDVEHREWFKIELNVPRHLIKRGWGSAGSKLLAFTVKGATGAKGRSIDLSWLSLFKPDNTKPIAVKPRAKRGVVLFPEMPQGVNTGEGRLPFPDRETTVLPPPNREVAAKLEWRYPKDPDCWDDFAFRYAGGKWHRIAVGGGFVFVTDTGNCSPAVRKRAERSTITREPVAGGGMRYTGSFFTGKLELGKGTVTFRPRGHVMTVDLAITGGHLIEVRFGDWEEPAERISVPFLTYRGYGKPLRPHLRTVRENGVNLFALTLFDWTQMNGTTIRDEHTIGYDLKSDMTLNPCYERLTFAVSTDPCDVLPVVPNPVSPWKHVTGSHVWLTAAPWGSDPKTRGRLLDRFRDLKRRGFDKLLVCDHEAMWRDGDESYTFRTNAAPAKGGDAAQYAYTRVMIDELGYRYGPYNNFIDLAPVNGEFCRDRCARRYNDALSPTWVRCYAARPTYGVEASEIFPFELQRKFRFNTAYCDLITATPPWGSGDADARIPGAETAGLVFYTRGETLLLQKKAWNGPVYSEGGCHFAYCGLADGSYGQDPGGLLHRSPWLADFTLRRLAPLCCDFGMGALCMFWTEGIPADKVLARDRFLAATVAFGHTGFLLSGGREDETLSYFMIQAAAARYTQALAKEICYADASGQLLPLGAAIASGALDRSQIVTTYSDGTVTAANGSTNLCMNAGGFALPPNGYAIKTGDGEVEVFSGDQNGRRIDWARAPEYALMNGRGQAATTPVGATDGLVVRLFRKSGEETVIATKATFIELPFEAKSVEDRTDANKSPRPVKFTIENGKTRFVTDGKNREYRVLVKGSCLASSTSTSCPSVLPICF